MPCDTSCCCDWCIFRKHKWLLLGIAVQILIASGSDDARVKIWDITSKKAAATIESKVNPASTTAMATALSGGGALLNERIAQ